MEQQDPKNAWSVILAVVIATVIVGGSVYWWQNKSFTQPKEKQTSETFVGSQSENTKSTTATLLQDNEFGLKFIVSLECEKYLKVTKSGTGKTSSYTVTLPLAKEWSGTLMSYDIMTQTEYDGISNEELPGKPKIKFNLGNGLLLTNWDPQDIPPESDLPQGCNWDIQRN